MQRIDARGKMCQRLLIACILLLLMPTLSSMAEPISSETILPTYGNGRAVEISNPFAGDDRPMENKSGTQSSSISSPPGETPEKNNWGQYMKEYYRSGRYLTQQTDFFGRQTAVHQILSLSAVTASPIMLNNDEVGGTLCKERIGPVNIYGTVLN